eukprot:c10519_g1_i1.p1 GENE.c10519_g1_i1~~c10519_g1_i1.p1  ORF type:complete len:394 (+),score=60.65 c10519_g1_i1:101-1282(+)
MTRNTEKKSVVQKCTWSPEEDEILTRMVTLHGPKRWSLIAHSLEGRVGKQCRERWHNHLNPDVRKDAWTPEEDELIFELVEKLGTKWASISKHLDGRTDNSIKNRYYSSLKKIHDLRRSGGISNAPTPKAPTVETPQPKKKHACPNPAFEPKRKRPSVASLDSFVAETEQPSPDSESSPWSTLSGSESTSDILDDSQSSPPSSCPPLKLPMSTVQVIEQPVVPPASPSSPISKSKAKRTSIMKVRKSMVKSVPHTTQAPMSSPVGPSVTDIDDEGLTEGFLSPASPALSIGNSFRGFDESFCFNQSPEIPACSPTINRFGPYFMATPPRTHFSYLQPSDLFDTFPAMDLPPSFHSQAREAHDFDPHDHSAHHNDLPLQPLSLLCEYQLLLQKN